MFEYDHSSNHLFDQPPNRFDHHPVLRGLLASSAVIVSAAGSGAGVTISVGEGVGAKLSPLETGAGSRTVDRRRGASGSGMDGSEITGTGAGAGDIAKSATVSCVTGSLAAGVEN
jgi:hypothetical protein